MGKPGMTEAEWDKTAKPQDDDAVKTEDAEAEKQKAKDRDEAEHIADTSPNTHCGQDSAVETGKADECCGKGCEE